MTQHALPAAFLSRMARLLGDEFPAFLASFDATPSTGLRVNTLKITPERFREIAPFDLAPVPWCPAGFVVDDVPGTCEVPGTCRLSGVPAGKHPYHAAGLYYLQDPAAMAATEILAPQPGERVLDLAAAPGGKATHIASLMAGEGLLIANEIHHQRAWDLAENLERWGGRNIAITVETPERLAERFEGFFDAVLLDAPCSGEGMLRRSEAARREWAPELIGGCSLRQSAILEHAARLVRPGGRLAYATCTFAPEEDEGTVARFLQDHPEFELMAPPHQAGFAPGRPEWIAADVPGNSELPGTWPDLTRAVRLWPHLAPGEGHFIALLRKCATGTASGGWPRVWRPARLPRAAEQAYRDFCMDNLMVVPATERLALVGSYLYALPPDLPDLTGLRFLHPGWWLGAIKGNRFEPSHALALALRLEYACRTANLAADRPEILAYLRGETFPSPGDDGWALVAVDGYPLGWGKRVGRVMKSKYPKGLRRG
ncbi:MAG: RsmB/NOP family class I SAM-dependent RNA methyltransferase [Chloroflexi bacterium]|nr:RsmB/NOP family class I SAM-dependent RNA methyltransferase [Chloroflexota bacterium]